ncbi:metal-dependent hydrolase [Specibacter sp. RAF43]|uniref:metal-dependent hydrolase n=1 Tax=Specibacter sp. RAF43 TaxID=3233057 RepID=UPI003F94ED8B
MNTTPDQGIEVTWLGHAAFSIRFEEHHVLIDPWLDNPASTGAKLDPDPTTLLVTHGHFDHLGQAVELSLAHGIPLIAPGETGIYCKAQGCEAPLINLGGIYRRGNLAVKCVPAVHSTSVGPERAYGGLAAGYVLNLGGFRLYHAGDTALFSDMKLISSRYALDLALLPIGGTSTMGPEDAVDAVRLLEPRFVIPMHFDTWDFISQDAQAFAARIESETSATCILLDPGSSHLFTR